MKDSEVKERDGHKYSLKPFHGHEYRYKITYELKDHNYSISTDVYSTNKNTNWVNQLFSYTLRKNHGDNLVHRDMYVSHKSSREADENMTVWLNEVMGWDKTEEE